MFCIQDANGRCLMGMGGDVRLFSHPEIHQMENKRERDISVIRYIPNIHHLESLEYLEDIGFTVSSINKGDSVQVSLDTIWNNPMTNILNTVLAGDHIPNKDHPEDFIIQFKYVRSVQTGFMDMDLIFDVLYIIEGFAYKPSEWIK